MKKLCNKLQAEFHFFASCKMVNKAVLCKQNFWQLCTWERQRWRGSRLDKSQSCCSLADLMKDDTLECKYPCRESSRQPCPQARELLDSYHPGFQVGLQNKEEKVIEMHRECLILNIWLKYYISYSEGIFLLQLNMHRTCLICLGSNLVSKHGWEEVCPSEYP